MSHVNESCHDLWTAKQHDLQALLQALGTEEWGGGRGAWGVEREIETIAPVVLFVYIHKHIHVYMYITHFHVNTEPYDLQKECMYIYVHVCAPDL